MQIVTIIIAALLSENYVLVKFLGICPFLGVSKRINAALGMGMAVTFVMLLASFVCYFVYQLLILLELTYMQTVAFILVIASIVQLVEMFLKKKIRPLYNALGVYLPLITTNCAVLGVVLVNAQKDYNLLLSVINGGASGLGFALAQWPLLHALFPSRLLISTLRVALNSSPMNPSRSIQHRKAYFSFSVCWGFGLA